MNKNITEIAYILDRSGSMTTLQESAISGFNSFLKEQQKTPGDARFTLVLFDHDYLLHADRTPIKKVAPLDATSYEPRGSTSLLDAIGRTIDELGKHLADTPEKDRPGKVIVAIYTDGYENTSTDYSAEKIREMIRHQTDVYSWDFLFLAANEDAIATATAYGIAPHNASPVAASALGSQSAYASLSRRVSGSRRSIMGIASVQEQDDLQATLSSIVEEEAEKAEKN
jgi:hypothetical protein